ncbi:MAG: Holliday junction branch migration protein RuvA [bacterium]
MIESISGILVEKGPTRVVVELDKISLTCLAPLSTVERLPAPGAHIKLWTHLLIREEQPELFGFATREERWLFLNLLTVSGVGSRLALVILSGAPADDIRQAVVEGDADRLTAIPRVGPKLAQRLVLELRERLADGMPEIAGGVPSKDGNVGEAIRALLALGFGRAQADRAVKSALQEGLRDIEEIVRHALRVS